MSESKIIYKDVSAKQACLVCPQCKTGTMQSCEGIVFMSSPAQYPHKCSSCEYEIHFSGKRFPLITYEEVSDE